MQRSIVEHEIQLTLYIYQVYIKINQADHFSIGWRVGKESIQTPNKVSHDDRGRVIINNQLTLNIKIAYDTNTETYKEKKGFLMFFYSINNQNKLGGVLTIDVAKQLTEQNKDVEYLLEDYPLEKSPDKTAAICIGFRWKLLSENSFLNKSFYLNESMQSIRSDKRIYYEKEINELGKENQEIRAENQSLREQLNVMVRQIQSLLKTKQNLQQENRYLQSIKNNSLKYEIQLEENNMQNSKIKSMLSEHDLQDLKALQIIREECLRLQSLKTEDSENMEYKEHINIKENEIQRLNDLLVNSKERIDTLQYLNNILLKQEETKDLKITKLEQNLEKVTTAYEELNIKKEQMEIRLEEQIQILTGRNDEMEEEIVKLRQQNNHISKQLIQQRQSIVSEQYVLSSNNKLNNFNQQILKQQLHNLPNNKNMNPFPSPDINNFPRQTTKAIQRKVLVSIIELLRETNIHFTQLKRDLMMEIMKNKDNSKFREVFGSIRYIQTHLEVYLDLLAVN